MSLGVYSTVRSEQVSMLGLALAKREIPVIDQFEPIADFEELLTFAEAHPTPIEFAEAHPAWRLESVAARVIEALGIAAHESLDNAEWKSLAHILLEYMEYLYTYPQAPTDREKLAAGSALALAGSVCCMLPQSELWRLAGFGRIAATLTAVSPLSSDTHVIHPLEAAFLLASSLNLPILDSAIECYNTVLNRNFTYNNRINFPLSDKTFFGYLNLEFGGLEDVKSAVLEGDIAAAISKYTIYRKEFSKHFEEISQLEKTDTFGTAKSYLDCLLKLSIYPTPPISATTEIGIAVLLFPEFRPSEQLLVLVFRRYKWIVDAFFYPDGFHRNTALRSQSEAITDFSRFLHTYDKVHHSHQFECAAEMKALLEKLIETCIYICQPDLYFPPFGANVVSNNLDVVELCKIRNYNRKDFEYIGSQRKNGSEPQELSHALPYAGYYVMRDSWESDAQYLCFDCGALGKPGYEDKLSFVLFAHGRQLITHDRRNRVGNLSSMTSGAHNVILIDGKRQPAEPEIIPDLDTRWITTSTFDFVEGWYKSPTYHHKRSIFYVKGDYFILHDVVLGEGEHLLEQNFHLGSSDDKITTPHIVQSDGYLWTREQGHSNIFIGAANTTNLDTMLDGNKLTYHGKRELPAVLNVVLFPTKLNVEHLPTVHSVSVRADADVLATGFTVKSNGITDTFLISDDGYAKMSTSETDEIIEFEGEYLFLRGDKFVMLNGRYLKVGNKVLVKLDEPCEHYVKSS